MKKPRVYRFKPTDDQRKTVKAMAAYGIPHADIAAVIGISAPTLVKNFRDELSVGQVEANAKVAQSLFQKATAPGKEGTIAAIFWLKCRAGWREKDSDQPGKKEIRQASAEKSASAGRFAVPAGPKLVVDNRG